MQEFELRKDDRIPDAQLPMLWILASSVSLPILAEGKAEQRDDWLPGIYFCGNLFKTAIVAINQLPQTEETLWLRILGRDATQQQAISEVLALPKSNPQRGRILQMLTNWRVTIELTEPLDAENEALLMALSQAYLEWEQSTQQRGEQQGERKVVEALLKTRFGTLDQDLRAIIPQILAIPDQDYTPLLLQMSRDELLIRFA